MPKRKYIHEVYTRPVYGKSTAVQRAVLDSKDLLQRLELDTKLQIHQGCVNTLVWNEAGSLLLSGSDDHNLVITDIFQPRPVTNVINTPHTANIISAQFLSGTGDTKLVSCADSTILHTDINQPDQFSALHCHSSKVYEVLSVAGDPHSFLTCGEDGTVRWVDTRVHPECSDAACQREIIIECDRGVGSISLNPLFPWELAVGSSDSCVRMYDRRMLSTKSVASNFNSGLSGLFSKFSVAELDGKSRRITSVKYRPDGKEVLVSFSSDYLYIFNPRENVSGKNKRLKVGRPGHKWRRAQQTQSQQQPVKKFRLRGDWSDTGPRSRPEAEASSSNQPSDPRDRMSSQAALMQRMTFALSRMLNDPGTRLAMQRLGSGSRNREESSDSNPNVPEGSSEDASLPGGSSEASEGSNLGHNRMEAESSSSSLPGPSSGTSSLPQPQSLEASSASLIQERWRQYRERKMAARAQEVIEVETTNQSLADSLIHPDDSQHHEEEVTIDHSEEVARGQDEVQNDDTNRRTTFGIDDQDTNADEHIEATEEGEEASVENPVMPMEIDPVSDGQGEATEYHDADDQVDENVSTDEEENDQNKANQNKADNQSSSQLHDPGDNLQPCGGTGTSLQPQGETGSSSQPRGKTGSSSQPHGETGNSPQPHGGTGKSPQPRGETGTSLQPRGETGTSLQPHGETGTSLQPCGGTGTSLQPRGETGSSLQLCGGGEKEKPSDTQSDDSLTITKHDEMCTKSLSREGHAGSSKETSREVQETENLPGDEESSNKTVMKSSEDPPATSDPGENTQEDNRDVDQPDSVDSSDHEESVDDEVESLEDEVESDNAEVESESEENLHQEEGSSRNLASLVTSYSNLVQSGVQPNLQLRYSEEGASTSSIQLQSDTLPGPMRVVTGQGQSGVDPLTGARRRRMGVSSIPTSSILPEEQARATCTQRRDEGVESVGLGDSEEERGGGLVEYESDLSDQEGDSDEEEEGGRTILQPPVINRFIGHRNVRTLILEGAWWGENYVLSGSDCGHFFAWDRSSAEIVLMREADRHVVNRVRAHPFLPILATSGIDHDVKIWYPTSPEAAVSTCEEVEVVTRRNQVMLEETRDTITVPASLMIRMLASLNQIRRGERESGDSRSSN